MTTVNQNPGPFEYVGDGVSTIFLFSGRIFEEDDVAVYVDDALQVLDTDYSVTPGGVQSDVVFPTPPVSGASIRLEYDLDITQETSYQTGGSFPAEDHEGALDKLTVIAVQQQGELNRSFRVPSGETALSVPAKADRVEKVAGFDVDGNLTAVGLILSEEGDLEVQGALVVTDTTQASGTMGVLETGAIVSQGGVSVRKDILGEGKLEVAGGVRGNSLHISKAESWSNLSYIYDEVIIEGTGMNAMPHPSLRPTSHTYKFTASNIKVFEIFGDESNGDAELRVTKDLEVGGKITVAELIPSNEGVLEVQGALEVTDTAQASGTGGVLETGAIVSQGGVSVRKDILGEGKLEVAGRVSGDSLHISNSESWSGLSEIYDRVVIDRTGLNANPSPSVQPTSHTYEFTASGIKVFEIFGDGSNGDAELRVTKDLKVGGKIAVADTTGALSPTDTGASISTAGGLAVAKHVHVGGSLILRGSVLGGDAFTIADDDVISIVPPRNGGWCSLTAKVSAAFPTVEASAFFFYDTGTSPGTEFYSMSGADIDFSSSSLTGTTGADGKVTISGQLGELQIENRYGSALAYQVTFL